MEKKTAFTLMEIMVVMIIVGVIAGFSIPNISKAMERSRVRRARQYMIAIHGASRIYKAKNGTYPNMQCGSWGGRPQSAWNKNCLDQINLTLGINIPFDPDVYFNYNYQNDGNFPATFTADVVRQAPCWVLRVTSEAELSDTNPYWPDAGKVWP